MSDKNKVIFIVGAGAIGKALAVFLTQQGKNVVLLRGQSDERTEYIDNFEVELSNGVIMQSSVQVSSISSYSKLDGIVVLTTKSYGNHQIAQKLADKSGNSPIVILQNGLNVEAPFIEMGFPEIYRCVLFTSVQLIDTSKLRFKPAADSPIGIIRGSIETLTGVIGNLSNSHLVFRSEENIQPIIWTKAIINCVFNSVCPLLETDNGIFYRNEKARSIARNIIDECVAVAGEKGIQLNCDTVLERLLLISKTSDGQLISTYQDILNKRKTEIETLNLSIAHVADKLKKSGLVSRTGLLGELIQIKSEIAMLS